MFRVSEVLNYERYVSFYVYYAWFLSINCVWARTFSSSFSYFIPHSFTRKQHIHVFKPQKEMGETATTTTKKSDDANTAPPKVKFALFDLDGCLYPIENGYASSLVIFYSFPINFFFCNKQIWTRVSRASVWVHGFWARLRGYRHGESDLERGVFDIQPNAQKPARAWTRRF